jgi:hypothetical protein
MSERWLFAIMVCLALEGCGAATRERSQSAEAPPVVAEDARRAAELEQDLAAAVSCFDAGQLRDQICALREKICALAERTPGDPELARTCKEAEARCRNARSSVGARCGQ